MIRTRFAPSPTGFLHIGSVRTALYAWLFARHHQGQFVLRIEDTDRERSTQASIDAILEGLEWLGIDYDEGPFYQMQRLDRYQYFVDKLLSEGKAYRCDCSTDRLEKLRETQMQNKEKPRYDGHCRERNIALDVPHVIRFLNPREGTVGFKDLVYGDVNIENQELDDLVLVRTDGVPTYNFSVVIDDWDMNITHVIRGDDHVNNTPRQINLLKALEAPIPTYAHLPIILGHDGKRLSKRHGAVNVLNYREDGYLPHTLVNYLARLGWSHGDQEIFSLEELKKYFDLDHVHRGSATYNPEKLAWLNQHYIKEADPDELAKITFETLKDSYEYLDPAKLPGVIDLMKTRVHDLKELAEKARYFFEAPKAYDQAAVSTHYGDPQDAAHLKAITDELQALEQDAWTAENISAKLKSYIKDNGLKFPQIAQPLRIALTGDTDTPSINEVLALIGRTESIDRIGAFLSR